MLHSKQEKQRFLTWRRKRWHIRRRGSRNSCRSWRRRGCWLWRRNTCRFTCRRRSRNTCRSWRRRGCWLWRRNTCRCTCRRRSRNSCRSRRWLWGRNTWWYICWRWGWNRGWRIRRALLNINISTGKHTIFVLKIGFPENLERHCKWICSRLKRAQLVLIHRTGKQKRAIIQSFKSIIEIDYTQGSFINCVTLNSAVSLAKCTPIPSTFVTLTFQPNLPPFYLTFSLRATYLGAFCAFCGLKRASGHSNPICFLVAFRQLM